MIAAALLVLLLETASSGPAPSSQAVSAVSFDSAIAEGCRAFDAFALADADRAFQRAATVARTPEQRAMAALWLGVVRAENGDFAAARARFAEAVAADPDVVVSKDLSPTIHQLVEEARAQRGASARAVAPPPLVDPPLPPKPRWALLSGGAVAAVGVLAVGGGAMVGMNAVTQRDVAAELAFQREAVDAYNKARQGAFWANVLYGAGGLLLATGSGLAVASFLGADAP